MPKLRHCLILIAASLAGCTIDGTPLDLQGQDVRLTILHTSDIHSRIFPYDMAPLKPDRDLGLEAALPPYGGVARLASLIRRERARSERVIHLDSGDCMQGAPIFNVNNGEAEFRWMSLIGADAVAVGNHEFDKGVRNFAYQAQTWATYPLLAANYIFDSSKDEQNTNLDQIVKPYTILDVKGLKVGVIGMGNLSSMLSIGEGGNTLGIEPLEQNETLRAFVGLLRPSVDVVVVVSHLGLTEDQDIVKGYDAYYVEDQTKGFLCADGVDSTPEAPCWKVLERLPPNIVHVWIPGVTGIDVIMGGHLHIVLNPSQVVRDPAGHDVIIQHSGAFAKYLGRLDLVVHIPQRGTGARPEVVAHNYRVFPVDAAWCADPRPVKGTDSYGFFQASWPQLRRKCMGEEDAETLRMLQPYVLNLDHALDLPRIFAYAPRDVNRRNETTGGDSPLGDLTAQSMAVRRRSEAQFALTNSLGIRDSLYAGPIKLEDMFNIFPFENLITVMYLSGTEVQQLFDFVTDRSAERGCQSQAQIAGASFVLDCGQYAENQLRRACNSDGDCYQNGETAASRLADGRSPWQCLQQPGTTVGVCYSHSAPIIRVQGQPVVPQQTYKIAVNDYIAAGGSDFQVLKRNTTKVNTGISLRDGLIDYLRSFCTCNQLASGQTQACIDGGEIARDWCASVEPVMDSSQPQATRDFALSQVLLSSGDPNYSGDDPSLKGSCNCLQAKQAYEDPTYGNIDPDTGMIVRGVCAHVTRAEYEFCDPETGRLLNTPIVVYDSDGRIERRVK